MTIPIVKFTIMFSDPDLDDEELESQAWSLLRQLREVEDIETVNRVIDSSPLGSKSIGSYLIGLLTAEISKEKSGSLIQFFREHIGSKQIELEVEANGRRLKLKAGSRRDLEAALSAAQKFVEA